MLQGRLTRFLNLSRRFCSDASVPAPDPRSPHNAGLASVPEWARAPLEDLHGRRHDYLRVSLTERCNLRCQYCMPPEGAPLSPRASLLTREELTRTVRVLAALGVRKLRLTGGEPTLRSDLHLIIEELNSIPGIESVSMTTNGLVLTRRLPQYSRAGLAALNISLDSLRTERYERMARRPGLARVLAGVDLALQLGFPVKINVVLMKGFNDDEILDFVEYTKDRPVEVRFIEFMPFSGNSWKDSRLVPYREALRSIVEQHPELRGCTPRPNDTARVWQVPGYAGRVGFISSMTNHFCSTCNRLRITADGNLKVCLFGNAEVSLRDALRNGADDEQLAMLIRTALKNKKPQHAANQRAPASQENRSQLLGVHQLQRVESFQGRQDRWDSSGRLTSSGLSSVLGVHQLQRVESGLNQSSLLNSKKLVPTGSGPSKKPLSLLGAHHRQDISRWITSGSITSLGLSSVLGEHHAQRVESVQRYPSFDLDSSDTVRRGKRQSISSGYSKEPLCVLGEHHLQRAESIYSSFHWDSERLQSTSSGSKKSEFWPRLVALNLLGAQQRGNIRGYCTSPFSHLDSSGRAKMVDVSHKRATVRTAAAECRLIVGEKLLQLLKDGALPKGDALGVARVAGVLAAKRTSDLIPLCHPLPLDFVHVTIELPTDEKENHINILCEVRVTARTGAEMEALSGCSGAALALYDMCKAVDKDMVISGLRVVRKTGGKSDYPPPQPPPPTKTSKPVDWPKETFAPINFAYL